MGEAAFPENFLQSLQSIAGFHQESFEKIHRSGIQVVSIRINPVKVPGIFVHPEFAGLTKVPWSSNGYYLPERPIFTFDPLLHAGAYYVQEASGMFLEQCIRQTMDMSSPIKVLDLCAAPGGKSTIIQSLITDESLLVSNEVIKSRTGMLIENTCKWGAVNNIVTNNDAKDFGSRMKNYFDLVVIDAPCSGSGLFRRDPSAMKEWSTDAVEMCSQRQQRIIADVYDTLKHNGVLIYSTCSYSSEENEEICDWFCETFEVESIRIDIAEDWNIHETSSPVKHAPGYRFFPDQLKGEGFFVACFRKKEGGDCFDAGSKKSKLSMLSAAEYTVVRPWLNDPETLHLYHLQDEVFAFPKSLQQDLVNISLNLYTKKAGVLVGKLMRKELLPAHELALSRLVSSNVVTVSLKKEDALRYLRREEIIIETDERGWALVLYEGMNIGWVKILHSRVNNYYPKEWRILKAETIK